MLLIASYIFYGYWDCRFLSLIFISTVIDYFVANKIVQFTDLKRKKQVLLISLVANLGMLGFFKYYGFFIQEFNQIMHIAGISLSTPVLRVVLPVGISFYTFQTLSYTIDVYRGQTKPTKNFMDFALYVSFF
ncbi:MAG: MBOAT family protein, partial [Calditrichales bacterium]|nr:MBOAT family protein [Calditrichales bacterium]